MVRMKFFVCKAEQKHLHGVGSRKNCKLSFEDGGVGCVIDHWRKSGVEAIESFVSSKKKQTESTFHNLIDKNWTASSTKMISFVQREIRHSKTLEFQSCASKKGKGLIDSAVIRLTRGRSVFGMQSGLRFSSCACEMCSEVARGMLTISATTLRRERDISSRPSLSLPLSLWFSLN